MEIYTRHKAEQKAIKQKKNLWYPFKDAKEWELAKWLLASSLSQKKIDRFLKLETMSLNRHHQHLSFKNKGGFFKLVDKLSRGPRWKCEMFAADGDVVDERTGKRKVQTFELWKWDPVECIKELIGNPAFKEHIQYAPEHTFKDHEGLKPIVDEMWTAKQWVRI
ncbi:uncharacterized protein PHACADRAFT_106209 [Phanerochaete carnosa HHB-10118-sp]|uniref:Uncharacterized protein n=1 Tax=Phanerochaete carnosa (strain HHB-10118-sp) TaxID=650164 RepID=K5WH88_PHACS|nr:uncharacterized protein PHACADRAFT_106209 [Phanerochaete carnosa HHB-10118-sp]EKM49587.1 hypothetical protein PHACADRAFT_106209 [Phanerochaete carnosa HHB-10118-sp]